MENTTKNEPDRTCSNCKYFKRHYVVSASRFMPLNEGHCGNASQKRKTGDVRTTKNAGCQLWQPRESEKPKQRYCLELLLQSVDKRLEEILAVLRDAE